MTICNMTIEGGGRAGMIAPDETTFEWVEGRRGAPADFEAAVGALARAADRGRRRLRHRGRGRRRRRSRRWSPGARIPGQVVEVTGEVPEPELRARGARAALHGPRARAARSARSSSTGSSSARARTRGSATCARRRRWSTGRRVASTLSAMVVPGSAQVKARGRGRGARRGLPRRGLRLAQRRLLDVPGDEPRHRSAPASAAPRPRTATSRAARARAGARTSCRPKMAAAAAIEGRFVDIREWELSVEPVEIIEGKVSVLDRADVDTDQIIPKQFLKRVERTGFGEFLFYDWIRDGEIELEPNPILVAGPQLRLRLVARARPLGAPGLRLRGDHRALVRRHLLRQLHQDRAAAGDPRRRRVPGGRRGRARRGSTSTTRRSTRRPAWSGSRSTRRSSTGSSTASTTSG